MSLTTIAAGPTEHATPQPASQPTRMESFVYDDSIVRMFMWMTIIWVVVATLAGLLVAVELALPEIGLGIPYIAFGRLRPLHTNAAIFAFAGNAIFTGVYYSLQRLCKARMFSDFLSRFHFWGWQLIIVAAALTLPTGHTTGKEYAELEWPIDIAIALVWVVFAVNVFGTIAMRRERHMYVAIWFYIATIVTVAMLHIFNSLELPAGPLKSYSIYAGVQDAIMQWWYGHNAVAFFLTTPFLGLMYYFMPKAAERPVFSYRLSIIHFWSLIFMYIWAGPHHLHYTACPEWASTLGMVFSVMLWMPSWGGGINGLLTLRGAWHKLSYDPVLKFFVIGVTFYMMSTFEGPMLSVKSVNALSHYTDWTIAHVHGGALGWNGFISFGMIYWLAPRLFQTKLYSQKLANMHFWLGLFGILVYVVSMWTAGITQGLMWRGIDEHGRLMWPDFIETVVHLIPYYWIRAMGGALFIAGIGVMVYNIFRTWQTRPAKYEEPEYQAPALSTVYAAEASPPSRIRTPAVNLAHKYDKFAQGAWHRRWERMPLVFSIWTTVAVATASLFEIIPTFLIQSNVPTIATVTPYTPLELAGRDVYLAEGCYNCHSQMIRPLIAETKRFGEYSKPGESVYDHPFQWGSRRIGPDLAREGVTNPNALWHVTHFRNPRDVNPKSVMPRYSWLLTDKIDFASIEGRVRVMKRLGVPYKDEIGQAEKLARAQALSIAQQVAKDGGPEGLEDKQVIALIAYIQRLGTDLYKTPPAPTTQPAAVAIGK